MTSPKREREAAEAAQAYQLALTQLGVQTIAEAIALWDDVPPKAQPSVAAKWLNAAVKLIMGRRSQSVKLARAYYRLSRALLTGTTVADPYHPDPPNITLGDLRRQFADLAGQNAPEPSPTPSPTPDPQKPQTAASDQAGRQGSKPAAPGEDDDQDRILVEEIKRLREQEEANARAAEEEIRVALEALGPANQRKRVEGVNPSDFIDGDQFDTKGYDKALQDAHDQAGMQQAASAGRIAMNGARSTTWLLQEGDKRALGWVRISTTGTPCGWCAMLISRGPVYRSERSATFNYEDGDKYHDNCHCVAIPVFTRDQFANSPMFDLNRLYGEQWPKVTQGLGGKSALTAWRRYIRQEQASQRRTSAA